MKNWKVWAAFLAVFAAGALAGVLGSGLYMQSKFSHKMKPQEFRKEMRERFMARLIDEVNPDKEKYPAIKESIRISVEEMGAFRAKMQPQIRDIFQRGEERVKAHLTPEEIVKFDKMLEKLHRRKFGLFKFPPPPPRMGPPPHLDPLPEN
ncbi:MAG: hypothetical protein ACNI27_13275 [Desulfovibrio sp.]